MDESKYSANYFVENFDKKSHTLSVISLNSTKPFDSKKREKGSQRMTELQAKKEAQKLLDATGNNDAKRGTEIIRDRKDTLRRFVKSSYSPLRSPRRG